MSAFFPLIIMCWVLIFMMNKKKLKQQQGDEPGAVNTKAVAQELQQSAAQNMKKAGAARRNAQRIAHQDIVRRSALKNMSIQDSRHDWLSRQMEEERVAYRRISAMLGLKLEHSLDCKAEELKRETKAAEGRNTT